MTWRWGVSLGAMAVAMAYGTTAAASTPTPLPPTSPTPPNSPGTYTPPPSAPLYPAPDVNGVDLASGRLTLNDYEVAIGPKGSGLTRIANISLSLLEDNYNDYVMFYGLSTANVTINNQTYQFTSSNGANSGATFTSTGGDGAQLSLNGKTYTFKDKDGLTATLSANPTGDPYSNPISAMITSLVYPNGEQLSFTWREPTVSQIQYYVLSSVNSSRGLQIKYSQNVDQKQPLSYDTITGINSSLEYCNPSAMNCSFKNPWPSRSTVYNSTVSQGATIIDPLSPGGPRKITGAASQTIGFPAGDGRSFTTDSNSRITSFTNNIGTWSYCWNVSGAVTAPSPA